MLSLGEFIKAVQLCLILLVQNILCRMLVIFFFSLKETKSATMNIFDFFY